MSLLLNPYSVSRPTLSLVGGGFKVSDTDTISLSGLGLTASTDLIVFGQHATGTSGTLSMTQPAGYTSLGSLVVNSSPIFSGLQLSYKIAAGGETSVSGSTSGVISPTIGSFMWLFRASRAISLVTPLTFSSQITDNNPTLQTVAASGLAFPAVVLGLAGVRGTASFSFSTASPAFDAQDTVDNGNAYSRAGYKIYNTTPSDHSIDIDDNNNQNALMTGAFAVN